MPDTHSKKGREFRPAPRVFLISFSGGRDVDCLQSLLAPGGLEGYVGPLFQGFEPAPLYTGVVHEEILPPSSGVMKP
jgi:hypothetical protein